MPSHLRESKSAATIRRRRQKLGHALSNDTAQIANVDCLLTEDPESVTTPQVSGPPMLQLFMSSDWLLFLGLLAFRIVNALIIQTSFVPDEYWQSVEVAHNMAFGYGYLTWEWKTGLRGYLYPSMFAVLYKILGILHLDYRLFLTKLPRLIQGIFAALADWYLYRFARRVSGVNVARWTLLCQLTSWFTFYCCVRTLTNSMETSLSTIALYYYPWPGAPRLAQWKYMVLVGLAVIVRPTAAILWLPLCGWHLWLFRYKLLGVIKLFLQVGIPIIGVTLVVDRIFYNKWIFVPYHFLEFNVLSGQGTFYGSHPWHWYITQGFPVIMGTQLIFFMLCIRYCTQRMLLVVLAWTVFVYSLLGHKEFRFIYPVLPIAFYICGNYLHSITSQAHNHDNASESQELSNGEKHHHSQEHQIETLQIGKDTKDKMKLKSKQSTTNFSLGVNHIIIFLVITNLPIALYTSLIHQRGTVDVMRFLHEESKFDTSYNPMRVLELMPCHSTPYYSYVHKNVSMRFLTCEPNLHNEANYFDEAAVFYKSPVKWLQDNVLHREDQLPSHLVMFNVLQPALMDDLIAVGYRDCAKFFHSHVVEGRVGSHVIVMCRNTWLEGRERARRTRAFLHMA